jgi:hypothetical protein
MRPRLRPFQTVLLLTLLAGGCSNKLDQAARQRVFSPEDPSADIQRANEDLKVADAASDGALWSRLWKMDRLEATHRIGGHRSKANVHFKWTRNGRTVELTEDQVFETQKDGSFHATVTNDQDSGFEYVWANGHAFSRGRYGPFHERRTDRAQQDSFRDQGTSALRTVFGLFQRRLHGATLGDSSKGTRFALSLGDPWGPAAPADLTKPVYGMARVPGKDGLQPGPDEDTARRLELDNLEEPTKVNGEILVDDSGVILKANVKAKFKVAPAQNAAPAMLEVEVTYDLKEDEKVHISPPTDVVTMKLPHAVNDPLWFTHSGSAAHDEEDEVDAKVDERADDEAPAPKTAKAPAPADKGGKK